MVNGWGKGGTGGRVVVRREARRRRHRGCSSPPRHRHHRPRRVPQPPGTPRPTGRCRPRVRQSLRPAGATTTALGLVDLGGRAAQARADLVDLDLVHRALLTLLGLVGPLLEPALHDHAHAALEGLRDVLGRLAPDVAGEEEALAVLPLVGLLVHEPRRRGDAELGHGRPAGGEAQLGVVDKVADDGDDGVACCHGAAPRVVRTGGSSAARVG